MTIPRYARRRTGMTLIYLVIAFTALVGVTSFAVDYGKAVLAKSKLKGAVDAATLAGASGLAVSPTEVRTRAKATAALNMVNGQGLVLLDSDIELGTWNPTTGQFVLLTGSAESTATAVRVTGRLLKSRNTAVGYTFLPVIAGPASVDMSSSAVGGCSGRTDVVVVQDITTSFSSELSEAKTGDKGLLTSMNTSGGKSAFGLVVFSGWGKTIAPLQLVAGNYTALTNSINSVGIVGSPGMLSNTGTDIASGIEQAISVFDAYSSPAANGRAMVIVSDGQPDAYYLGKHPTYSDSGLLTLAQQDADAAWAKKIHVYVVFWDDANDQTAANNLKSLCRGKGIFVHVTDPNQLAASLSAISKLLGMQIMK